LELPEVDSKKLLKLTLYLALIGGFVIIYFLFNPSEHSFFLPCPLHYATGYHCPGCGSQRAIHQLLHGNVQNAFWINPLLVLTLPILIYAFAQKAHNYVFNTQYRVGIFYSKTFIYGYFGIAILFWVLRNIPHYPFTLLAPS